MNLRNILREKKIEKQKKEKAFIGKRWEKRKAAAYYV
jgi:hypothetical protein